MAQPNGPAIRYHRQRSGKTIAQLAEAVGCSYVHLANVELGHNTASPELLWRITNFLGLDDIAEIELPNAPTSTESSPANSRGPEPTHPPGRPDPPGPPGHPDRDAA